MVSRNMIRVQSESVGMVVSGGRVWVGVVGEDFAQLLSRRIWSSTVSGVGLNSWSVIWPSVRKTARSE